jgi:hypothetical protein
MHSPNATTPITPPYCSLCEHRWPLPWWDFEQHRVTSPTVGILIRGKRTRLVGNNGALARVVRLRRSGRVATR